MDSVSSCTTNQFDILYTILSDSFLWPLSQCSRSPLSYNVELIEVNETCDLMPLLWPERNTITSRETPRRDRWSSRTRFDL